MASIEDILAEARPRERTVKVCIRGDLAGRMEELQDALAQTSTDWEPSDLSEMHPGRAIAEEMKALREQIHAAERPFTLRYIGDKAYSDLMAAHPSKEADEAFDSETFPRALIAASCVDPVMSEEQAAQLFEKINEGEIKRLFDAAWDVHNSSEMVPFSLLASGLLAALGGEN
jgi:hypothetical protein